MSKIRFLDEDGNDGVKDDGVGVGTDGGYEGGDGDDGGVHSESEYDDVDDDDDDGVYGDDGVCVMTNCTEVVSCLAGGVVTPDNI